MNIVFVIHAISHRSRASRTGEAGKSKNLWLSNKTASLSKP